MPSAGCAACCGVYNAKDRHTAAFEKRMMRRARRVADAGWDPGALAQVRADIDADEAGLKLTDVIPSCAFAGFIDADAARPTRLGCLIHPLRHPTGADLRDLGVYPKETCEEHRCAPHDWLKPAERALAATCQSAHYGTVVTDAGFIKALHQALSTRGQKSLRPSDIQRVPGDAFAPMWATFAAWPHRDPDVRRFGAFYLDEEAGERALCDPLDAFPDLHQALRPAERTLLAGLSTHCSTEADARAAVATLRAVLGAAATILFTPAATAPASTPPPPRSFS